MKQAIVTLGLVTLLALPVSAQLCKDCNAQHDCFTTTGAGWVNCASNGTICHIWTTCGDKDPGNGGMAAASPCIFSPSAVKPSPQLYAVWIAPAPRRMP